MASPPEATRLLRVPEVAKILGISEGDTRRKIYSGELVSIKIGKRAVRVAQADLEAFIASRRGEQKKPAS